MKGKKIVALKVMDERTGDSKMFKNLVEQADDKLGKDKIKHVLADGGYDANENFDLSGQKGMES